MTYSPVDEMLRHSSLRSFEDLLHDIKRWIRPPACGDYHDALSSLLELARSLGPGWEIPIVTGMENRCEDLLAELSTIAIATSPTRNTKGLVAEHPVWTTLRDIDCGYNSPSCTLALSFWLRRQHKFAAADALLLFIRTLHKDRGDEETGAQILADIAPAPTPEEFFGGLQYQEYRLRKSHKRMINDLSLAAIRLPSLKAKMTELRGYADTEEPEFEQPEPEIYSSCLYHPNAELLHGEPADEALASQWWVELDRGESSQSFQMQFIHATNRFRTSNALWVKEHTSALTRGESKELARWLMNRASNPKCQSEKISTAELVALIMLATGRNCQAAFRTIHRWTRLAKPVQLNPYSEQLEVQLPELDSPYQPTTFSKSLFIPTSQQINLPIPERLVQLIFTWQKNLAPSFQADFDPRGNVVALLKEFRKDCRIPAYIGQLPRTLGNQVYAETKDPIITQWLTGDLNSHSEAGMFYVAIRAKEVINAYIYAMWPILAPEERLPLSRGKEYLGAQGRPKNSVVTRGVDRLMAGFKRANFDPSDLQHMIRRHNLLTTYVTAMLTTLVGHRPVNSLLRLNRWDFDLDAGLALFSDKKCDPAHIYRPVALGSKVSEQLRLYSRHLTRLAETVGKTTDAGKSIRSLVKKANGGERPWFFWLNKNGTSQRRSIRGWRKEFQDYFVNLQPQFGRTVLASQFREITLPKSLQSGPSAAELAHIQLGHLELIGFPFDSDSPTELLRYAHHTGPLMDQLFNLQGWHLLGGLLPYQKRQNKASQIRPEWFKFTKASRALSREVGDWNARTRNARKKFLEEARQSYESALLSTIRDHHSDLADQIENHISPGGSLPPSKKPIQITNDDLKNILQNCRNRKDRAIITNILEDVLQQGKKGGWYAGPLPCRFAPVAAVETTRFLPGMFKARYLFQWLRQAFVNIPDADLSTRVNASSDTSLARLILALVLFGGVTEKKVLAGIINHHNFAIVNPAFPNGVLVPVLQPTVEPESADSEHPMVWALWHIAAVSLLHYSKTAPKIESIAEQDLDSDAINNALESELLPHVSRPANKRRWIDALLAQANIVRVIEMSGAGAQALDSKNGCWSIPLSRQYAFLSGSEDRYTPRSTLPEPRPVDEKRTANAFFSMIKNLIPKQIAGKTDKEKAENNKRYRLPNAAKIEGLIGSEARTPLEKALGHHAHDLLLARKSPMEYYAFSTVSKYLSAIGERLIDALDHQDLSLLGRDEYISIYSGIVQKASFAARQTEIARQLIRFHEILRDHYGAPYLDRAEIILGDEVHQNHVDARIILPNEIRHAHALLETTFSGTTQSGWRGDQRRGLQSRIFLHLLSAVGPRTGEIFGLQHRDIYVADGEIWLIIQNNLFRGIKTKRARRRICLSDRIQPEILMLIESFQQSERQRIEKALFWGGNRLLFLDSNLLDDERRGLPVNLNQIRQHINSALRHLSPDSPGPYQLRHTIGTRSQIDMGLGMVRGIQENLPTDNLQITRSHCLTCRLPRDARKVMVQFGHVRYQTTNRSYGHMPWAYLYGQAWASIDEIDLRGAYAVAGINSTAATRARQRHGEAMVERLIKRLAAGRKLRVRRLLVRKSHPIPEQLPPLPEAAGFLIDRARQTGPIDGVAYGISEKYEDALRDADRQVTACTGYSFFDPVGTGKPAIPRIYESSRTLLNITNAIDRKPDQLRKVLERYLLLADHRSPGEVRLPGSEQLHLEQLLKTFTNGKRLERFDQDSYKAVIKVYDQEKRHVTRLLAWVLSLCAVLMQARSQVDTSNSWKKRALF